MDGKPTYEVWELVWNSRLLGVKADLVIPSHERWVDSHKEDWRLVLCARKVMSSTSLHTLVSTPAPTRW